MRKGVKVDDWDLLNGSLPLLIHRGLTPHRVALEDLVAYQWEGAGDLLGHRQEGKRNAIALRWLSGVVRAAQRPTAVLDVGCSYGNHLFMLNAVLGKPQDVQFVGIDLFNGAIERANAFAKIVPGFTNCSFQIGDLSEGLAFADRTFEAINLCDVLEHMLAPEQALRELWRILKPGGTVVISTPLKDGLFKRLAAFCNRMTRGRLYRSYYTGKDVEMDASGNPIMNPSVGHNHVSELSLPQLQRMCLETGFALEQVELMPVMSGSRFFDRHLVLLAGVLVLEALHERLGRPSWAHSVMVRLRKKE